MSINNEWVRKVCVYHTMEYYLAMKKNEIMPQTATWLDLEIIILSEVRQMSRAVTYMWNLKYDTNELTYETEIDSQTQGTDLWWPVGGAWGRDGLGVGDQQVGTIIHRVDKQQGPTVRHRELISVSCDKP